MFFCSFFLLIFIEKIQSHQIGLLRKVVSNRWEWPRINFWLGTHLASSEVVGEYIPDTPEKKLVAWLEFGWWSQMWRCYTCGFCLCKISTTIGGGQLEQGDSDTLIKQPWLLLDSWNLTLISSHLWNQLWFQKTFLAHFGDNLDFKATFSQVNKVHSLTREFWRGCE